MKIYSGKHDMFGFEENDCAVRCLANLSGLNYHDAHSSLSRAGRRNRKETDFGVYYPIYEKHGIRMISVHGFTEESLYLAEAFTGVYYDDSRMSVSFCVENLDPTKSYAVMTVGHIFSVIKGAIFDKTIQGEYERWVNEEIIGVMEVFH